MNSKFRRFLNPLLAVSFLVLAVTGIMLLVHAGPADVGEWHEVSGIAIVVAGLLHVLLNGKALLVTLKHAWTAVVVLVAAVLIILPAVQGQDEAEGLQGGNLIDIALPAPVQEGGMPLMRALKERKTARSFADKKLPTQTVSNLLWAAFGINRADGKRTAPSTRNWQEIEIYAVTAEGVYRYDPTANRLRALIKGDLRRQTGNQAFVASAPLDLVYIADQSKAKGASGNDWILYSAADAAFISQNIYLFCASENLATVVRGAVDRKALAQALQLPDHKSVILTQTVGYPGAGR